MGKILIVESRDSRAVYHPVQYIGSMHAVDRMVRARHQSMPSFYLYDNIDWMNISCLDAARYRQWKHSDDFWVLRHALTHPKRTRDASKARLFLVGGLFNLLAD